MFGDLYVLIYISSGSPDRDCRCDYGGHRYVTPPNAETRETQRAVTKAKIDATT